VLSRIKNEIHTNISDKRLNALSLMAAESNLVRGLDFESVINRYDPSRRVKRNCKPSLSVCSCRCSANSSCFTVCALKHAYCIVLAPC